MFAIFSEDENSDNTEGAIAIQPDHVVAVMWRAKYCEIITVKYIYRVNLSLDKVLTRIVQAKQAGLAT